MENKTLLNRLRVKGLFGTFNYDIQCQPNSLLTIITGPNGFGKTTLLQSVVSVFQYSLSYFFTFPFQEMFFEMGNGGSTFTLTMIQTQSEQRQAEGDILLANQIESLTIILDKGEEHYEQKRTMQEVESMLEEEGYIRHLDEWIKDDVRFTLRQVFEKEMMLEGRLFDHIPIADFISGEHIVYKADDRREDYEKTLSEMATLMSMNKENFSKTVTDKFAQLLQVDNAELLVSEEELSMCKVAIAQIKKHGLCSVDLTAIPNLSTVLKVLGTEISELKEDLLIPLQQYEEAIANKQFENKYMLVDQDGISFYTKDKDELISSESLSSGEKQVVALYYDLCFEKSVSMIIIDEPETSWHVSWQIDFIEEMKELAATKQCQVFVATHSPYIINKSIDLVTDLYEQGVQ